MKSFCDFVLHDFHILFGSVILVKNFGSPFKSDSNKKIHVAVAIEIVSHYQYQLRMKAEPFEIFAIKINGLRK